MTILDWVLVVLAVLAALAGWRQGLVAGVLSFVGFVVGGVAGAVVAQKVLESLGGLTGLVGVAVTVGIILVGAGLGNALAAWAAGLLHDVVTWKPARFLDSVGGAAFRILTFALLAWVVASTILALPLGGLSAQVRGSTVLSRLDDSVPGPARDWIAELRDRVSASGLPDAFSGFSLDSLLPVGAPDPALLKDPAVRRAWGSLIKVEGIAPSCQSQIDGSGFVYAPDRVMTNAHVVAGVEHPTVLVRGTGKRWPATVVYLDTELDVAVLHVPGLGAPTVSFADAVASRGDSAVVAGFPGGGELTATPARIRGVIDAEGTDIYGHGTVVREVYSIRGDVRHGNSGGPLLSPDGHVYGVIFAASIQDPTTAYALTARQVSAAAAAGRTATRPVATGACSVG